AAIDAAIGDYVDACIAHTGRDAGIDGTTFLVNLGTVDAAADMDVLRSAIGEEKLTYLGFSYGTLLGAVYADRFPGSVRAMVLDGAVDPQASPEEDSVNQAAGFQGAFEAFATWCTQQAGCPLGTDPTQATTAFQDLTRPLLDRPLPLSDGRVLTYDDAITGTAAALYSNQYWPTLLTGLTNLSNGDGLLLMLIADSYHQRDSSGHYAALLDVFNAVNCMDNERPVAGDTNVSLDEKLAAAAPFENSGDPVVPLDSTCSRWPGERTLDPNITASPELATVVVISTTGDPATPYAAGQNLAKELNAHLITVNGDSHTASYSGIGCVDDAVTAYLTDVTLPKDGLVCP
ncbi:MAG: alpha/beta hydrolase, partial [Nakamurella sp.]